MLARFIDTKGDTFDVCQFDSARECYRYAKGATRSRNAYERKQGRPRLIACVEFAAHIGAARVIRVDFEKRG